MHPLFPPHPIPPHPISSCSGKDSLAGKLLNGAVAGVTGTLVIYPLDMIKTRLQSQRPNASGHLPYRSGLHCAQEILRKEGILGFYRGLGPNLVGITPEKAIKLGVNDYVRARFAARQGCSTDALPVASGLVAGAAAGFSQVIATNPMEIVKIRMQVAGATASSSSAPPLTAIQVVRQLGLRGLYKGTCATLLRDVPFSILFFPLQAHLKYLLRQPDGTTSFTGTFWGGIVSGAFAGAAVTPADGMSQMCILSLPPPSLLLIHILLLITSFSPSSLPPLQ